MATVKKFEELEIWNLSRDLYQNISSIADRLKMRKEFRFAEQIRSSSGAVMDNIAEGFCLGISKGELGEIKSQLYRCLDDRYISGEEFLTLYNKADLVSKKIASFMIYLNSSNQKGLKFKDRSK